jgi:DMSO/TMAO reductase YedYZ molybdopterin-dependent catalytic subunit
MGTNLTAITTYTQYLLDNPDVAIGGTQYVDPRTYRLAITGLVNSTQSLTYNEVVNGFSPKLRVTTLLCVEGWSVIVLWQGVSLTDLLNYAGISSGANTVIFLASDGYSSSLPLQYIEDQNIMIAYKMNNVTLTPQLGWPFFLVATNQYGYKWVEWVTEINVSEKPDYLGYWESRGYPNDATVGSIAGSAQTLNGNHTTVAVPASKTFSINPQEKQTFTLALAISDQVNGSLVIAGGASEQIKLEVTNPSGNVIYSHWFTLNGTFNFSADTAGNFNVTLDNSGCSCVTEKNVTIDYAINGNSTSLDSQNTLNGGESGANGWVSVVVVSGLVVLVVAVIVGVAFVVRRRVRLCP